MYQVEEAAIMAVKTSKWRQEFGAGEIQEEDFTQSMLEKGTLFARWTSLSNLCNRWHLTFIRGISSVSDAGIGTRTE